MSLTSIERSVMAKHPAKFSDSILTAIAAHVPDGAKLLDPFAGTGRIHELTFADTYGIEIQPQWAKMHYRTQVGDATQLPFDADEFDIVATSPTYGNRFADKHNAKDGSVRRSYTHDLGEQLEPNNSGGMQWGPEYRALHQAAWREVRRVLKPRGLFLLNISNHIRKKETAHVAEWHLTQCIQLGFELLEIELIDTKRHRQGQNHEARAEHEYLFVMRLDLEGSVVF